MTDLLAGFLLRHCTETRCRKCSRRAYWYRRKAWRTRKSPIRILNGRK
jgi:hypothetical protein